MSKGEGYRKLSEYRSQSREPAPKPSRPAQPSQPFQNYGVTINMDGVVQDVGEIVARLSAVIDNTIAGLKMIEEELNKVRDNIKASREKLAGALGERESGIALRAIARYELAKVAEKLSDMLGGSRFSVSEMKDRIDKVGLRGIDNRGDGEK